MSAIGLSPTLASIVGAPRIAFSSDAPPIGESYASFDLC
jgi:hypothetical protein